MSSDIGMLPLSMRDRSSTSSIIASRCSPAVWMWPMRSRCVGVSGSAPLMHSSCAKPSTAFSGVRNSWLMRDRKSVFAAFARCAAATSATRPSRTASSAVSRAASMRTAPMMAPTPANNGSRKLTSAAS